MDLPLTLSDDDMAWVVSQAARRGHPDVVSFILSLVEDDRRRVEDEAALPLIREALESGPATPMTREDWDSIREEVRAQLAERVR